MFNNKSKSHAVYKPLINANINEDFESRQNQSGTESESDHDDHSIDSRTRADSRFSLTSRIEDLEEDRQNYTTTDAHQRQHKQFGTNNQILLAKLRGTLFVVVLILFIIFIVQLTTDSQVDTKQRVAPPPTEHLQPARLVASHPTGGSTPSYRAIVENRTEADQSLFKYAIDTITTGSGNSNSNHSQYILRASAEPQHHSSDDTYSVPWRATEGSQKSHNTIEDDLNYPGDDDFHSESSLGTILSSSTTNNSNHIRSWWTSAVKNVEHDDNYVIVTNFIRATKSFNQSTSITLTSQATTEFIYHSLELCKRWDGPISVAVFCPGQEMPVAITLIQFMRQCLSPPLSACIRDKITWHLVYNRAHGPPINQINYPKYYLDSVNYPLFAKVNQCPKLLGPDASNTIAQFEKQLRHKNGLYPNNYRKHHRLIYPINVLRNTARLAAKTHYILASDIELYPSSNLVPMFAKYIHKHNITEEYKIDKYIFTLPIFEVKSNVTAPYTKKELVSLLSSGDAIFFHKFVCDWCQNFANRDKWLQTDKASVDNVHAGKDKLVIFEVAKRDRMRDSWEPIFIGTNDDPLYDDRLSWEGRRDKMSQMYEMCLLDYHMLVLGNAFLVHAPGIKYMDEKDIKSRHKYMTKNNSVYETIISKLKKKYSSSPNINNC